jgi:Flp pilus assembly protein TadD
LLTPCRSRADRSRIRLSSPSCHLTGAAAAVAVVGLAFSSGGYPPASYGMLILAFALVVLVVSLVADEVQLDRRGLVFVGGLGALALWALVSVAWAATATWPVLEAERGLAYAAAAAALVLVVTPRRVTSLVAGIVGGATFVALFALGTRLFPGRIGEPYDPAAGYQLAEPIGYWNALGLLLAFGLLLGAGLAVHARRELRAAAAVSLVPLSVALYFTFSRGAIVALLTGLVVLLALDRRALVELPFLALAPAAAVILASRSPALTHAGESLDVAQAQGRRLALLLVPLAVAGAVVVLTLPAVRPRRGVRLSLPAGRFVALGALVCGIALALSVLAREGGPSTAAERALEAFRGEQPSLSGSLDRRLLSVSGHGRADYWRVAAGMVQRAPLLGEGAGGFERRWTEERPAPNNARDAHNLYLETLAELGPLGLALLVAALAAPLAGFRRSRRAALGPAALAAYCAFLVHAALDWDWEIPLLVLPALGCASVLLATGRASLPAARVTTTGRVVVVLAASLAIGIALVVHVGNSSLAESVNALERGDPEAAAAAAYRATTWAPWSHEPWQLLGEARLAEGRDVEARRDLERAIERAPSEWRPWFDLAIVSKGASSRRALTRARELNPLSAEILDLERR